MKRLVILCGFLLSLSSFADAPDPRPDMHGLASELSVLQKYIFSEAEFVSPANSATIKKSLQALDSHLSHLSQGTFANDPVLKANLSLMQQHIKDASRNFNSDGKSFARQMLQSSLQMCIACHTRKKAADFSWPELESQKTAPLDRANFLFATRQFKKGVAVYEEIVGGFPDNGTDQWNLRKAFLALAIYYARVLEDPAAGAKYFQKMANAEKLPIYLREEVSAWSAEFAEWARERPNKALDKLSDSALLSRAKMLLQHDDFSLVSEGRSFHVRRLRAASILQRVLEFPAKRSAAKGEALLYLGQIYPRIASSLFFRFGEMYLKACISDYSKTKIAQSCYIALELIVADGYSGSAGTDIPDEEQAELARLRRLAY